MSNKKTKILLVEDDNTLTEMYTIKFQEAGHEVIVAKNGTEGLELAKKHDPDIILLDIILPEMDGFAVLKDLKSESKTKKTPVILLSNLGQEADIEKGKKLGAADYMVKANFTPAQVLDKVTAILKK